MSSLTPFSFESREIRVLTVDDAPWFVAKDVLLALEYSDEYNPSRAIAHVPDEWKGVHPMHTPGGKQEMLCISEPGLYFFLGRSDKPKALPFQKWAAGEVFPAIRKTGSYALPETEPVKLNLLEQGMRLMTQAKTFAIDVIGLTGNQAILSANQATFKAVGIDVLDHFGHKLLPADPRGRTYTPTELGAKFNPSMSPQMMNSTLRNAGLQTKEGKNWEPTVEANGYYEWVDTGKKGHEGTPVKQLRWFESVMTYPLLADLHNEIRQLTERAQAA